MLVFYYAGSMSGQDTDLVFDVIRQIQKLFQGLTYLSASNKKYPVLVIYLVQDNPQGRATGSGDMVKKDQATSLMIMRMKIHTLKLIYLGPHDLNVLQVGALLGLHGINR